LRRRKKGDFDSAIADYTKAIDLKTDKADAYNGRGAAKQEKGYLAGAIADLTKAVELKPNDGMGGGSPLVPGLPAI
jgi:Flp pilus assembly protein TadD